VMILLCLCVSVHIYIFIDKKYITKGKIRVKREKYPVKLKNIIRH